MKREFVINRHGKDYVLYAGLLDEAHAQGLKSIHTQLVQIPSAQNGQVAICLAEVITDKGTYTGLGDASPENVNRAMSNSLIRLAETRAKARALRDAINVNLVSVEELSEAAPDSVAMDDPQERAERGHVTAPPRLMAVPSLPAVSALPPAAPSGHTLPSGVVPLEAARPRRIRETPSAMGVGGGTNGKPVDVSPATPTQIETIAKLARSVGRPVPAPDLSRAAASELITRLSEERYGRRGRQQWWVVP